MLIKTSSILSTEISCPRTGEASMMERVTDKETIDYLLYFSPAPLQEKDLLIWAESFHLLLEHHRPESQCLIPFFISKMKNLAKKVKGNSFIFKYTLRLYKMFEKKYNIVVNVKNKLLYMKSFLKVFAWYLFNLNGQYFILKIKD